MIVELCGLPASGKTTLAKTLKERCGFDIIKIQKRSELLPLNVMFIIKHPIFSLLTLYYIVDNSSSLKMLYYKFMNVFLHHNAKYEKAKNVKYAVIDEGLFHNIYAIFERPINEKTMSNYIRRIPTPDTLVVLDIAIKELEKRTSDRGYLAREDFTTPEYRTEWLRTLEKNNLLLLSLITDSTVDNIVINDASGFKHIMNKLCSEALPPR